MINNVKNIVFTILNKEKRGPITPTQLIDSCTRNQNRIYSGYFDSEIIRAKNRSAKGLANDSVKFYEQRLAPFFKEAEISISNELFALPSDHYFIDRRGVTCKCTSGDYIDVDIVKMPIFKHETGSDIFPIGVITSDSIKVSPLTVIKIYVDYYKTPTDPKWTYTEVDDVAYFNASASDYQDFELHPSEENNLIMGILSDFGIVKRESDMVQLINSIKQAEENVKSRLL